MCSVTSPDHPICLVDSLRLGLLWIKKVVKNMQNSTDAILLNCIHGCPDSLAEGLLVLKDCPHGSTHTLVHGVNLEMHTAQLILRMKCRLFLTQDRLLIISYEKPRGRSHPYSTMGVQQHLLRIPMHPNCDRLFLWPVQHLLASPQRNLLCHFR
jgi:hypothetical protein